MKKRSGFALALALVFVFCFAGCRPSESAQTVVENAIIAVQNMDVATMESYWGQNSFSDLDSGGSDTEENSEASTEADLETRAMMAFVVRNLQYQIIEENEEKETTTVKVQITNTDMSLIMSEFMSEAFEEALTHAVLPKDQQPSDEEMNQIYLDIMTSLMDRADNPTVTNTVDIKLTLIDNKWIIEPSDEAVDAMLGISLFSDAMNSGASETGSIN